METTHSLSWFPDDNDGQHIVGGVWRRVLQLLLQGDFHGVLLSRPPSGTMCPFLRRHQDFLFPWKCNSSDVLQTKFNLTCWRLISYPTGASRVEGWYPTPLVHPVLKADILPHRHVPGWRLILPHRHVAALSECGLAARPSARSIHVWFMFLRYNQWAVALLTEQWGRPPLVLGKPKADRNLPNINKNILSDFVRLRRLCVHRLHYLHQLMSCCTLWLTQLWLFFDIREWSFPDPSLPTFARSPDLNLLVHLSTCHPCWESSCF